MPASQVVVGLRAVVMLDLVLLISLEQLRDFLVGRSCGFYAGSLRSLGHAPRLLAAFFAAFYLLLL